MVKDININIKVFDGLDPNTFSVADFSEWGFISEKPSIIEILLPDKTKVVHYFEKGAINQFNSVNLGLNCGECYDGELISLPDGVYTITVKGSPDSYNKTLYYLRTVNFDLEVGKYLINVDFETVDSVVVDTVIKIMLLEKSAHSNIIYGNIKKSIDLMELAKMYKTRLEKYA